MKKIARNKLNLDRQIIAVLGTSQLVEVAGGRPPETKKTQCEGDCTMHPTQFGLC